MAIIYGISEATKEFLNKLPKEVKSLEDIDKVHKEMQEKFDSIEDKGIKNKFSRWQKKRQIRKIEENKDSVEHRGAKGEILALEKLSELSDDYHIFCGVNKDLGKYVTYRRKRDLKSAQMDFVVVSKRGVILIEVKNWSSHYYKNYYGFSPHEQVDRAGRVLWISLKSSWFSPKNPPVTSVLLSIQAGSIPNDPNYGYVVVKNLNDVNYFIQNKEERFSDKEVKRLIDRMKGNITK
ncbi:MAG: nuclease-related domain-containing protein [Nitrosopumilaceae archaeon]